MRVRRIRIQVAVLMFILLPATIGIVAVHASATCERFVRTYVTKPIRNSVSRETADAWEKWRIGHPNWKPNPNVRRPKYVMTREEAVDKVDFACSVPTIPTYSDALFTPVFDDGPPPAIDLHDMTTTQVSFPDLVPPEVAELTPPVIGYVPVSTPDVEPIPEPTTLVMVGSAFGIMCLLLAARSRRLEA